MSIKNNKSSGFVAISSLLVIAAIILIIGTSVSLLSVSDLTQSLSTYQSDQSLSLVESCIESALLDLSQNNSIGTVYTLPEGDCQITLNSTDPNWDFTASFVFKNYTRQLKIKAIRDSIVTITAWQIVE